MLVSAELRWFWKGNCPDGVSRWFENQGFPAGGGKPRTDRYLDLKGNPEIGVKQRGVKPGLEVKGLVGRLPAASNSIAAATQLWCKWNADFPATNLIEIRKTRRLRKFAVDGECISQIELDANEEPPLGVVLPAVGCNLEKTRIEIAGRSEVWHSIGLEAFGDMATAPSALAVAINALGPLPAFDGWLASYPEWLAKLGST